MLPRVIVLKAVARALLAFFYVSLVDFFPTGRSSGLAEREQGSHEGPHGLRSAFVSPPSLYFPFGDWELQVLPDQRGLRAGL
jgi:hypothetical protein